jgi:hypothetical protein
MPGMPGKAPYTHKSQLTFTKIPVPLYSGDNRRLHYDPSSSTRDCAISRTPGQHMVFEQTLIDFKRRYPSVPILIIIPISSSAQVIADMTSQLIQFSNMFGHGKVLIFIGVGESEDEDLYSQVTATSKALHDSRVMHRVQHIDDPDIWTQRTLLGYMTNFEAAVILRGVICATDLVRLVIHSIENGADMTCALDLSFSSNHLIISNPSNLNYTSGAPVPSEDLLRSRQFVQVGCCDGAVKVLSFRAFRRGGLFHSLCQRAKICPDENSLAGVCNHLHEECGSSAKIMISPSIKSSSDPDDFRSAIQLGFTDLQGYDYRSLAWKRNKKWSSKACY